jgi:hypothetical protein
MKTLSTLVLLTAATAAQAYTLDVNVGQSRHSGNYDDVSASAPTSTMSSTWA